MKADVTVEHFHVHLKILTAERLNGFIALCLPALSSGSAELSISDGSRSQHAVWHLCHLLCSLGSSGNFVWLRNPMFCFLTARSWRNRHWELFFFFSLAETSTSDLKLKGLKQTGIFLTHDMKVTIIGYITIIEFALLLQVDLCGKSMFLQLSRYAAMPY